MTLPFFYQLSRTSLYLILCVLKIVVGQWNLNVGPGNVPVPLNRDFPSSSFSNEPGFSAQSSFFPIPNFQLVGNNQRAIRTNSLSSDASFANGQSNSGESNFFASGNSFSSTQQVSNSIGTPYYGARLGSLNTYQHGISGDVYAVDDETLLVKRFTYDGQVPDASFYIGNSDTVQPYQALRLSNVQGQQVPLTRSDGQDVVFKLGSGGNIRQYRWLAVLSILANSNFGEVIFPREFSPPKSVSLGPLTQSAGYLPQSVRSGLVTVINDKQIQIQNFFYDSGQAPDAYFWVGTGSQPGPQGTIVPYLNSYTKLPTINGQAITLTLPGSINIQSVNWLAVWSRTLNTDLAYVMIPSGLNVPPTLAGTPQSSPETASLLDLPNCEVYGNGLLQVRWALQGQELTVQLTGRLDDAQYMAFGLSGSQNRVFMINSDVTVAFWDLASNSAVVEDYMISARQECDGSTGVCPDRRSGGANDIQLLTGSRENGYLTVQYKRQINTGDRLDMVINPEVETYIVWAIGPLNRMNLPAIHYSGMHATNERIRFGRTPNDNCPANLGDSKSLNTGSVLNSPPIQQSTIGMNWPIQYIIGNQTRTFIATIGPAGGAKGYSSLYGKSAPTAVVWYINGRMAPELVLRRSETYRFIIYGGNNPRDPTRYHPFYITADSSGGYSAKSRTKQLQEFGGIRGGITQASGIVLPTAAGQYCEFTANTPTNPDIFSSFEEYNRTLLFQCDGTQPGRFPITDGVTGVFDFTPTNQDPSTLYYQCFNHKDMGGRITLVSMYRDFVPTSDRLRQSDDINAMNNNRPSVILSRRNESTKTTSISAILIFTLLAFLLKY